MKLLSIPVGAADLERVWSSTLLLISSTRTKMDINRGLKCVQLKCDIQRNHAEKLRMKKKETEKLSTEKAALLLIMDDDEENEDLLLNE